MWIVSSTLEGSGIRQNAKYTGVLRRTIQTCCRGGSCALVGRSACCAGPLDRDGRRPRPTICCRCWGRPRPRPPVQLPRLLRCLRGRFALDSSCSRQCRASCGLLWAVTGKLRCQRPNGLPGLLASPRPATPRHWKQHLPLENISCQTLLSEYAAVRTSTMMI